MPARRRHEVRREQHLRPGRRATFDSACSISAVWRCVSRPYATDVLVRLREQARRLEAAARAGDARHRVGDDAARLDEPEREQRRAARGSPRSDSNRATATCACVASSSRYSSTSPYAKRSTSSGARVRLAVPARVHVGAAAGSRRRGRRRGRRRRASSGQRAPGDAPCGSAENTRSRPREVGRVERREPEVAVRRDRATGYRSPTRRARVRVGGDVHDLDLGVAGEQPQQLGPRVP